MSDKERLEEIKKELELYWSNIFYVVNQDDMKWLINRIEELEEERDEWKYTAQSYYMTNQELREQNKRYRKALEFYANKETYESVLISESQYDADGVCISNDEYLPPIIYLDEGETARKVLEG